MKKILVAGLLLIMLFTFPISASAQTVSFEAQKSKLLAKQQNTLRMVLL